METNQTLEQEVEELLERARRPIPQSLHDARLAAIKRLAADDYNNISAQTRREFQSLENEYKIANMNDYKWHVTIDGPVDTPYHNGTFLFEIDFANSNDSENTYYGSNYPSSPSKIRCLTKIFHLNIEDNGNVKMKILGRKSKNNDEAQSFDMTQNIFGDERERDELQRWNMRDILKSIEKLFIEPDLSEYGKYIAREKIDGDHNNGQSWELLFKMNRNEYNTIVKQFTQRYANVNNYRSVVLTNDSEFDILVNLDWKYCVTMCEKNKNIYLEKYMSKDIDLFKFDKYFTLHKLKKGQSNKYIYPCEMQYSDDKLIVTGFLKRKILGLEDDDKMIKIDLNDIANIILKYYVGVVKTSDYIMTVIVLNENDDDRKFLQQTVLNQESWYFDGKVLEKDPDMQTN